VPDHFRLMSGSFLEIGPLFTSGSLEHLRALQGGATTIDRRRFRPNVYVDSATRPAASSTTTGSAGRLPSASRSSSGSSRRPLWCVTSTLAQEELPRDLGILRIAAEHHKGCLGVYAQVRKPGFLRVVDAIRLG
jgi:uncharacterized protein